LNDVDQVPDDSVWPDCLGDAPWLEEFRDVPVDATPPRFLTAVHPLAVGSYGDAFIAWADTHPELHPRRSEGLRWFQRLLAYRLLEHDIEGRLVWRNVLITLSRQCGKSWFLRALICWRIQQRMLFQDEEQLALSMANKLIAAQEVWRPAKFWGQRQDWGVRIANGEQHLESPDGGRWLVRAASDGVGASFSLSMIVVDEAWQVRRDVVESADAAMTESESPQLLLVSTAGDSSSDLFISYRADALDELQAPGNTLIAEWSTPRDQPLDEPSSWRRASPFWTERREREVADKFNKLERGEFTQNFLNWWQPTVRTKEDKTHQPFTADALEATNGAATPSAPIVGAVEDWFGKGWAVCLADLTPTGQARVSVQLAETGPEAAALLLGHAATLRQIVVGKTVLKDPAFADRFKMVPVMMNSRLTVAEFQRLLRDDAIRHDGSEALIEQATAVRVLDSVNGPSVRSGERMDAIKVAIFAAKAVRALPPASQVY
jgi:hypothetical protein